MRNPRVTVKTVPCGFCGASGKVESEYIDHARRICPVCAGRGQLRVPWNAEKCSGCNGTGKHVVSHLRISAERHFPCQGTGWVVRPSINVVR